MRGLGGGECLRARGLWGRLRGVQGQGWRHGKFVGRSVYIVHRMCSLWNVFFWRRRVRGQTKVPLRLRAGAPTTWAKAGLSLFSLVSLPMCTMFYGLSPYAYYVHWSLSLCILCSMVSLPMHTLFAGLCILFSLVSLPICTRRLPWCKMCH